MALVRLAAAIVRALPERILLLGNAPDPNASGYGWIEPGPEMDITGLCAVRWFWEKPNPATAERLFARGCLLNTFVMVAAPRTLWEVTRRCLPDLVARFQRIARAWDSLQCETILQEAYAELPPANFSCEVPECIPERLGVLQVRRVLWSDWGEPARVVETVRRIGSRPPLARARGARPSQRGVGTVGTDGFTIHFGREGTDTPGRGRRPSERCERILAVPVPRAGPGGLDLSGRRILPRRREGAADGSQRGGIPNVVFHRRPPAVPYVSGAAPAG